jgi:hypothetical protein
MRHVSTRLGMLAALGALALAAAIGGTARGEAQAAQEARDAVRFATFNASLNRNNAGE